MRTIFGRVWALLLALSVVSAVACGGLLYALGQVRSELRVVEAEHAQVEAYLGLSIQLRGLYGEYQRALDAATEGRVDFATLRGNIAALLLSLRGEIEREGMAAEARDGDAAEEPERDQLVALAAEIESILSAVERADALFSDGRDAQAIALLTEALNAGLTDEIDPLIHDAAANDRGEAAEMSMEVRRTVDRIELLAFLFGAAVLALAVAGGLLIARALGRSFPSLGRQMDRVALGGVPDGPVEASTEDFRALHTSLGRISDAHQEMASRNRDLAQTIERRTEAMRGETRDLRTQDQVRRDFLADISHELRTPLTVLRGVAEVALRTKSEDPEQLRTAMARIVDESNHVGRIVNDLFFVARSRAGALDLRTDIVDLRDLADGAQGEATALAAEVGGRLQWTGPETSVEIEGDSGRLRQLLLILIDNALKYGGRSPEVLVRFRIEERDVLIEVRDNGAGIAENDLPHVFERLYRGSSTGDAEPGGSGLGLAVAKSIVDGHGGSIAIANANGGGAIATVRLPKLAVEEEELEVVAQ